MRLTQLLRIAFPQKRRVPGLKYEGKKQKIKPIKTSHKTDAVNKLMRAEQNLVYINNPYVSMAEEAVYGKEFSAIKKSARTKAFFESKKRPFFPDRSIEEHYKDTVYQLKKWE